jgi:hypothetical protein
MVRRAFLGSRWSGTLLDGNGRVVLKGSGISNGVEADSATRLCVRGGDGAAREIPMRQATEDMFRDVLPWRTFRWYYGQQHYSGSYWASTMSAHVVYESRLELARLLIADFDASVPHSGHTAAGDTTRDSLGTAAPMRVKTVLSGQPPSFSLVNT